jgi:hypothetical protein
MATNGGSEAGLATCAARVATAERLARAIVLAFEACDEGGVPLSQIQRISVIEAALLEFDGLDEDLRSQASVGELLRALGRL